MKRIRTTLASIFVLAAALVLGSQAQAAPVGGTAQLAVATGAGLDANVTKVQYYGYYGYPRRYYPPSRYYYPPPRYYYPPAYYYPPPRYRAPYPCFGIYGGGVGFNIC